MLKKLKSWGIVVQYRTQTLNSTLVSLLFESLHFLKVTWIRIRDWHILTSGVLTYTADARFRVKHSETEASEWTLEIKFLQKRDEGTYYCQVRFPILSILKR